jgi:hypothetical protein
MGFLNPFLKMESDSVPIPTIETIFNGNSNNTCEKLKKNRRLSPKE